MGDLGGDLGLPPNHFMAERGWPFFIVFYDMLGGRQGTPPKPFYGWDGVGRFHDITTVARVWPSGGGRGLGPNHFMVGRGG